MLTRQLGLNDKKSLIASAYMTTVLHVEHRTGVFCLKCGYTNGSVQEAADLQTTLRRFLPFLIHATTLKIV
jgi:hypothetical protein